MKKSILIIPVLGLMLACSGGTEQTTETPEVSQEKTEAIEVSTQKVDEAMQSSEVEMDNTQGEIDELLSDV